LPWQRLFQLIPGYEDCNDAQVLRSAGYTTAVVAGRTDVETPLACQATLTRLENRVTRQEIDALNGLLLDTFIATLRRAPRVLCIDVDPTDDPCHGSQQLALFHGFFRQAHVRSAAGDRGAYGLHPECGTAEGEHAGEPGGEGAG